MRRSAVRKDAKEESDDPDDNDDDDDSEDNESVDQYRFISDESFDYLRKLKESFSCDFSLDGL
jgi:hypothetical protein